MNPVHRLTRNMATRRIAGVAAGLSDYVGIDATVIRVLMVVSVFVTSGLAAVAYLLAWAVIPRGGAPAGAVPHRGLAWLVAVAALVITAVTSARDHTDWIVVMVGLAIAVAVFWWIWRRLRGRGSWRTRKEFEKAKVAWQRRMDEQAAQANRTTYLGGNPFQIGSFYPTPPPPSGDD